ncbi:hypothetical protein ACOSQ3_022070 [Xanthoceras sorbifolium]
MEVEKSSHTEDTDNEAGPFSLYQIPLSLSHCHTHTHMTDTHPVVCSLSFGFFFCFFNISVFGSLFLSVCRSLHFLQNISFQAILFWRLIRFRVFFFLIHLLIIRPFQAPVNGCKFMTHQTSFLSLESYYTRHLFFSALYSLYFPETCVVSPKKKNKK